MGKLTVQNGKKKCRKCLILKNQIDFGYTKDDRYGKKYINSHCKACNKIQTYAWRAKNKERSRQIDFRYSDKLKRTVYSHYGKNGEAVCVNCGFEDIRALCIDHIFNNGAEERRSIKDKYFAGKNFYRWLQKNNYPSGYQTLCANCNLIKEINRRRNANNPTS